MLRKNILIASTVIASACLFGACSKGAVSLPSIQQDTDKSDNENNEKNDASVQISNESEHSQEGDEMNIDTSDSNTSDLMGELAQSVNIDYNIDSYENIQKFGYDLLGQNIHDTNPVLSPVSAYLALSMAGCGADGTTKDEFYNVLGNDMVALSDDMMNAFPAKGDVLKLSIANSAWIDDECIVKDEWLGMITSLMDAEAYQSNLSTEKTMNDINNWIEDKTNGLIDKMLTQPLDEMTRLALFNTVYFKGKWEIPFEAHNTYKDDFYLHKEQEATEQVDMMHLYRTDLDYISNDFAEGIILPYQNDSNDEDMAFVALKPTGDNDVRDVYNKLTSKVMKGIMANKKTKLVNLKLPKFEVTFDKELNQSLKNMGLNECFDMEKADFDQMGKTQSGDNLYIGLVKQKAKIIVDEEGTEAAAVTEVLMMCGTALDPEEPKELYFNEPFIYMIMDMDKEIPLFIGILDNPNM